MKHGKWNAITDVPGVQVGQVEDSAALTGVTAVLARDGAVGAVDVRGANPGTVHTDALHPMNLNESVHAVILTGGSLFGLATVAGVNEYLMEQKVGVRAGPTRIPVVTGAVIFDLIVGRHDIHPTAEWGYNAAKHASPQEPEQGNVGGGTGGTAGKTPVSIPTKGGTGTASAVLPSGATVGAIVCVNALGDVINPQTRRLYACAGFTGLPLMSKMWRNTESSSETSSGQLTDSTTIGCVATDAVLTKPQAAKVADMAHQGLARVIRPVRTMRDGDAVFALSVRGGESVSAGGDTAHENTDIIGSAAADVLSRAVVNGILAAEGIPKFPSYRDWKEKWEEQEKGSH